jgi:SAM-dependent methyltransferase
MHPVILSAMRSGAGDETIRDFGDQWTAYRDNDGFYGSQELFADIFGPHLKPDDLRGAAVADIGSGTGRIVAMMLRAGAARVVAVEPSRAMDVLRGNIGDDPRVTCLQVRGDELPPVGDLDYVISIGVLHHIPDPDAVVDAGVAALRPGGRFIAWVYGYEGNEAYVAFVNVLRAVTTRLPHALLVPIVWVIDAVLVAYLALGRWIRLPLADYLPILRKLTPGKRRPVVYDQLRPAYARYYTRAEAERLLLGKFENVTLYHRRGYSWTVFGTKPVS